MAKKKWKNYQAYLKSDEWKAIKINFNNNYNQSGWNNVCEVTGEIFEDKEKKQLHHHHFIYPKDWESDSPINIVKISEDVHTAIHEEVLTEPTENDLANREKYLSYLRKAWLEYQISEYVANSEHLEKLNLQLREQIEDFEVGKTNHLIIINALLDKIRE